MSAWSPLYLVSLLSRKGNRYGQVWFWKDPKYGDAIIGPWPPNPVSIMSSKEGGASDKVEMGVEKQLGSLAQTELLRSLWSFRATFKDMNSFLLWSTCCPFCSEKMAKLREIWRPLQWSLKPARTRVGIKAQILWFQSLLSHPNYTLVKFCCRPRRPSCPLSPQQSPLSLGWALIQFIRNSKALPSQEYSTTFSHSLPVLPQNRSISVPVSAQLLYINFVTLKSINFI